MKLEAYKETGKVTLTGVLLLLITTILCSVVLGVAYAYAIHYIPLIYLNLLCVMGVGYGIAYAMKAVSKYGKVRNTLITTLFSFITAVLTVYVQWVFWLKIIYEGAIILNPIEIYYTLIYYIMPYGTWGFGAGDTAVSGILLGLVWIAEAGIIIGIPLFTSKIKEIYCEECHNWVENETHFKYSLEDNTESLKNEFEQGNFEVLSSLKKLGASYSKDHMLLKFGICSECSGTAYASLEKVSIKYNKKGEVTQKEKPIVKTVRISKQKYNELSNIQNGIE